MELKKQKNSKISNYQFILSVLVVLIHSMTIFINLPGHATQYVYGTNFSTFFQIFIGDGIARIAVPTFFILSGYLFYNRFNSSVGDYFVKLRKRVHSLVIPYLFWSSITFFAFFIAQKIPAISSYFTTRNQGKLSLQIIIDEIVLSSYNSPLWYCRYLIVFALLALPCYWLGKKIPVILLGGAFWGWIVGYPIPFAINWMGIFFYTVGMVLAIHFDQIQSCACTSWYNDHKVCITWGSAIVWISVLILRTMHYYKQDPLMMLNGTYDNFVIITENLGIMFGVIAGWGLYDILIGTNAPIWNLSSYSFLIFVCHHPLVNAIKKLMMKIVGVSEGTSLLTFIVAPLISLMIIISFGFVVRRHMKPIWRLATGGRI